MIDNQTCPECGATVAPDNAKWHASWHKHIDRMLDVAAGNYDRKSARRGRRDQRAQRA